MIKPSQTAGRYMGMPKNKYQYKTPVTEKACQGCGVRFWASGQQIFCTSECRISFRESEKRAINKNIPLSSGSVGALAELMVCCDLMIKGYEVFRAVSPSCSSDLIACKGDKSLKIEVRTGTYKITGQVFYPANNIRSHIVAAVTHIDQKIHYFPEL